MKKQEKQRKFHQTLLNILYPPSSDQQNADVEEASPSPPSPPPETQVPSEKAWWYATDPLSDIALDDDLEENSSDDEHTTGDGCDEKLTRAQRKRLRRKKLKEAISQPRRELIGPLLPSTDIINIQGDKSNEVELLPRGDLSHILPHVDSNNVQNKVKNRRMAKRHKQGNLSAVAAPLNVIGVLDQVNNNGGSSSLK